VLVWSRPVVVKSDLPTEQLGAAGCHRIVALGL